MNLVKVILDLLLSGDVLGKLGSLLGTDDETTKKATSAAVPAMLSGLAGLASSEDGVHKLASTFGSLDPDSYANSARMLSGDTAPHAERRQSALVAVRRRTGFEYRVVHRQVRGPGVVHCQEASVGHRPHGPEHRGRTLEGPGWGDCQSG